MDNQIIVTDEGLKKLQDELSYLKNTRRKEVTEAIKLALSFGDLSENSEYTEAKDEQGKVESRIVELEEMLKNVKVISDSDIHTNSVNVGASVRLLDVLRNKELEYTIVGSTEADAMNGKISDRSPIGSALIGASVDEVVTVSTPAGDRQLKVLEIMKK
ncbi:MAG: transcription elongation factor GreA [Clostridia bacterium]|nr:transcription elongation factor GreA [Clostridia bacterium]